MKAKYLMSAVAVFMAFAITACGGDENGSADFLGGSLERSGIKCG